ncbi:YcxB family protein [Asticcacaulis sp. YBE204]|uniref:YcxB family protein n=1 Tax=Asticcacaulis sp. YBE204 TaxID=1282363 RepID=UPI0003C3E08F|nr:YcxB family protein [Asticcacaulis sp. YBE204]ESQ81257.1 hypothetical protein AEYBE204_02660 [Asticcacaulis sp. YBE204]
MTDTYQSQPYQLTQSEMREFYFLTYYRSARRPGAVLVNLIFFIGFPVYLYWDQLRAGHITAALIWVLAAVIFIYGLVPFVLSVIAWNRYRKTPANQSPRTVTVDAEGLAFSNDLLNTRFGWGAITAFRRSARLMMFYGNANSAFMVPVRAFATPETAEALGNFALKQLDGRA